MIALNNGFIPAANWLGIQAGYVFKCSDFGLGYYLDNAPDANSSITVSTRAGPSSLSIEEEQVAWQFAEGCEAQLCGGNGVNGLELSENEAALLKVRRAPIRL
jgi:hypothetical protein|eukprot:COSAG02_NODE_10405_length_1948_cov_1.746890_2_plen_103_part_00